MPPPTNVLQPSFVYGRDVSDAQYVDVAADFNTPSTVMLARGIYILTAVGQDIAYGIADVALTNTNGNHLPAGDTRLIEIEADNTTLSMWLTPEGNTDAARMNIVRSRSGTQPRF